MKKLIFTIFISWPFGLASAQSTDLGPRINTDTYVSTALYADVTETKNIEVIFVLDLKEYYIGKVIRALHILGEGPGRLGIRVNGTGRRPLRFHGRGVELEQVPLDITLTESTTIELTSSDGSIYVEKVAVVITSDPLDDDNGNDPPVSFDYDEHIEKNIIPKKNSGGTYTYIKLTEFDKPVHISFEITSGIVKFHEAYAINAQGRSVPFTGMPDDIETAGYKFGQDTPEKLIALVVRAEGFKDLPPEFKVNIYNKFTTKFPLGCGGCDINGHGCWLPGGGCDINGHGCWLPGGGCDINGHGCWLPGGGCDINGHGCWAKGGGCDINGHGCWLPGGGCDYNGGGCWDKHGNRTDKWAGRINVPKSDFNLQCR